MVFMKKRVALWLTALWLCAAAVWAQDVPEGVVAALKKGSSQELARYLDEQVDLLLESRVVSSDREATLKTLDGFFTSHRVNGFGVIHQGRRNESSFIIGTLATANGNYRVNCFFRREKDKYIVHQIRIDKTNE